MHCVWGLVVSRTLGAREGHVAFGRARERADLHSGDVEPGDLLYTECEDLETVLL